MRRVTDWESREQNSDCSSRAAYRDARMLRGAQAYEVVVYSKWESF